MANRWAAAARLYLNSPRTGCIAPTVKFEPSNTFHFSLIPLRYHLKGLRFIFLMNQEDLPEDAKFLLNNMRGDFQELGDAYMFKEALKMKTLS